jgi:hypothetical protein
MQCVNCNTLPWSSQGRVTIPVGAFSAERIVADYALVSEAFDIKADDPNTAFTNEFIDTTRTYPEL